MTWGSNSERGGSHRLFSGGRHGERLHLLIIIIVCGIVLVCVASIIYGARSQRRTSADMSQATPGVVRSPERQSKKEFTTKLLVVGDVFWGRAIERATLAAGGPDQLFRGLTAADKADFDAWIGNLECPVTDKDISYAVQVNQLKFNCRPEFVPTFAKWFTAVTLANNHTNNNGGVWGLEQTRQYLESSGVQYTGHFDMRQESDICEVVAVSGHLADGSLARMPIALCGYDYVGSITPKQSAFDQMKRYAAVMPVIALPHMGTEYRRTADQTQITTYRNLIDNGADVVVGAHPHVVQNSEIYKGKLIAYSVGNFLFDQQILGRDTALSLGVGITLTVSDGLGVAAYTGIADTCLSYKDTCAESLSRLISTRPKLGVSLAYECFDESSGTPVRATAEVCEDIRQRATASVLTDALKSL